MRTTSSTTGKTRRAATTLAALCLALPMTGFLGGTAYATSDKGNSADHGSSSAPGQAKKAEPTPQAAPAPAPYTNQGGVTTGSNTTKYETAADQKGSTYTGKGGGQPSGDIHSPQPYSNADQNNTGANDTSSSNQYKSTRDGSPSLNGNGGGQQTGQPCAGCVGKADNKNPPGQAPNGTDHNAGYECDRNHGIGRSNPAHTGCTGGSTTGGTTGTTTGGTTGSSTTGGTTGSSTTGGTTGSSTTGGSTGGTTGSDCEHGHMGGDNGHGGKDCGGTTGSSTTGGTTGASTTGGTTGGNGTGGSTGASSTGGSTGGGHHGNKNDKITICHATGSSTNPWVVITISKNGAYNGHRKHGDDIIPPYTYNNHGTSINVIGQNWTAANQATFHNGCSVPTPPRLCPNGSAMPASGNIADCNPPKLCPNGAAMPASGNVADCNPPKLCPNGAAMPASGNVADCNPPVVCPAGTSMVNGTCTPPVTCPAGTSMVNGTCTPPVTCPAGTTMAANGTCTPPVVCPEGSAMVGPIVPGTTRPGCVVSGDNGGPAVTPPTTPTTPTTPNPGGVLSNGGAPQPVLGGAPAPAVVSARPTALPFTGGNTGLLAEGAALMLLIGGGLVVATRRKAAIAA